VVTSVSLGRLIPMSALFSISLFLLGCTPPSSTENLDPENFGFYAEVNYFPATGEGDIGIFISYQYSLSQTTNLNLGKNDSVVITSGENKSVVKSIPGGDFRIPKCKF